MKWQLQEAKARFSAVVNAAAKKGPQIITKRGIETAVVVDFDEWKRSQENQRPSVMDILMGPGPRWDDDFIPPRRKSRRRPPVEFE
jgi:prevent-host-death family protein